MSNTLVEKFNMKGAKGEKVGFTEKKKKQFTQLLKVFASFFILYSSEALSRRATFSIWTRILARTNVKDN